jgi:hypothetical protein
MNENITLPATEEELDEYTEKNDYWDLYVEV